MSMPRSASLLALASVLGCGPGRVDEDPIVGCDDGPPRPAVCDPQNAMEAAVGCAKPMFVWTGSGCEEICECEGTDCGALYANVAECLAAYEPACGMIGLDTCPFETQIGAVAVSGTSPYGTRTREYAYGVFGVIHGENTPKLDIVLAEDLVSLGNHLFNLESSLDSIGVLTVSGGKSRPGEYDVHVSLAVLLSRGAKGTLTVTKVDRTLSGTLDVNEGGWQLKGEFVIPHCQRADRY